MDKILKDKRAWIIGLCSAMLALVFACFISSLVSYAQASYSALSYFLLILNTLISIAIYSLAIVAVVKKNKFWSKVLFIIYFSYNLMSCLYSFVSYLSYFSLSNGGLVWYGIVLFLDALCTISIGITYLLSLYGSIKNKNIIDILVYVRLGILLVKFITTIVLIATSTLYGGFNTCVFVLQSMVITFLFFVCIKFEGYKDAKAKDESEEINREIPLSEEV